MDINELEKSLLNPDSSHRSAIFWAWNAKLDKDELFSQMDGFRDKGVGGFFMHSREGLETEYLSQEWIDLVVACAERGDGIGLNPYIYDEDKWPSGMAGGKVTDADKAYAATAITHEIGNAAASYTYAIVFDGDAVLRIREGSELAEDEILLGLDIEQTKGHDWYSGSAPADNLNPDSVRKFIELTHERYLTAFGGDFKGQVKGFFTDEPNFADFFANFTPGRPWLPWTGDFEQVFFEKRGYSIVPGLPFLFYEGEGSAKFRHDYWRTLTELFSERYVRQIYDWCEAKGVTSCGHLLFENGLGYQARVCGAAMPHYRYFHVPGIDILGEQTEEYLTVKQCTSVANQYGRRTISETYGCSRWDLSFEGQKWLWDWQSVMGIQLRSQHLAQYSIKGCRKRDYPPFFNYQSQWWEHDKVMEDYCARLAVCAGAGEVIRPLLVIHPQSSIWCKCAGSPKEDLTNLDGNMGWTDPHIISLNHQGEPLNRFAEALLKSQCDFDFGDETILSENARCKDGKLIVGACAYSVVIVPEMCSIFKSTLELLDKFAQGGGRVIWVRELPSMIEGEKADLRTYLLQLPCIVPDYRHALEAVREYVQADFMDIHTQNTAPIMTSVRKIDGGYIVLAVNNDRTKGYECLARFTFEGQVREFSALTGAFSDVDTDKDMSFYTNFTGADAKIFFVSCAVQRKVSPLSRKIVDVHESLPEMACLGAAAAFTRTLPNTLTLDMCRIREGSEWSAPAEVWQIQRRVREKAGFMQIFGNGNPMRYTWISGKKPSVHVELAFDFEVTDLPDTPLFLAVEESRRMKITCNGVLCGFEDGYLLDKSIVKTLLENVRPGSNRIILDMEYTHEMELEDIYLCGDFAVDMQGHIVAEPAVLHFGDWCLQGYPNYAGSMIYHFAFNREEGKGRLLLGQHRGTLAIVRVNGSENKYMPFQSANPLLVDLQNGHNTIDIEVVGSNRNIFGPLHQKYTICSRIDWRDFRTEGGRFSQEQVLTPYGLMGQIHILRENNR